MTHGRCLTYQECVVQKQHDGGGLEGDRRAPGKQQLGDVTDVGDFRVLHAELPQDVGSVCSGQHCTDHEGTCTYTR